MVYPAQLGLNLEPRIEVEAEPAEILDADKPDYTDYVLVKECYNISKNEFSANFCLKSKKIKLISLSRR